MFAPWISQGGASVVFLGVWIIGKEIAWGRVKDSFTFSQLDFIGIAMFKQDI